MIKIHKVFGIGIQSKGKSLPLWSHGRRLQDGKRLRMEDNAFIGKSILNGMVEKGKVQGSEIAYQPCFERRKQVIMMAGMWGSECRRS